mmetsp:Transcript_15400/g.24584  ORF Transcript_15400/g.24584 Transcript_15400/m.24584 type:complete len:213 (-) Transcript_15400:1025-1663(-)
MPPPTAPPMAPPHWSLCAPLITSRPCRRRCKLLGTYARTTRITLRPTPMLSAAAGSWAGCGSRKAARHRLLRPSTTPVSTATRCLLMTPKPTALMPLRAVVQVPPSMSASRRLPRMRAHPSLVVRTPCATVTTMSPKSRLSAASVQWPLWAALPTLPRCTSRARVQSRWEIFRSAIRCLLPLPRACLSLPRSSLCTIIRTRQPPYRSMSMRT